MIEQSLMVLGEKRGIGVRVRLSRLCERKTYSRAKKLLVESEASRQGLKLLYGCDGLYVPHPLRSEFININDSLAKRIETRCMLTDKEQVRFVYVGNLLFRKGAIDAVRAFAKIRQKNTQLVLIGEGGERPRIESLVIEASLSSRVELQGVISAHDIVEEFKRAQFFVLPSYADTGPTALKEAIACGLYPIVYANNGPQDLVSHYGCGTLVETGNVEALTSAMEKCVANMADCVKSASSAALKVREELSKENVWSRLMQVYASVLNVK